MSNLAKRLFNPGPQPNALRTWVIWTGLAVGGAFVAAMILFSFRTPDPPPTTSATAAPRLPALADMISTATSAPARPLAPPSAIPQPAPTPIPYVPTQSPYVAPAAAPAMIATADPPPTLSPAQAETKAAAQADSVWFVASPRPATESTANSVAVGGGARMETPEADALMLRDGALIPAVMQSSIDSTLPGGYVKALVSSPVWDSLHNSVVIPTGSWLFGRVSSSQGDNQTRLAIEWSELQYSDGRTLAFDSSEPEVDRTGTNGVGATVDQHMGQVVKRILLTSVFVGAAGAIPSNGCSGGNGCSTSVGTGVASAAAANIASAGAELVRAAILRPTSHVSEGQPIALMIVHGPVSFPGEAGQ